MSPTSLTTPEERFGQTTDGHRSEEWRGDGLSFLRLTSFWKESNKVSRRIKSPFLVHHSFSLSSTCRSEDGIFGSKSSVGFSDATLFVNRLLIIQVRKVIVLDISYRVLDLYKRRIRTIGFRRTKSQSWKICLRILMMVCTVGKTVKIRSSFH